MNLMHFSLKPLHAFKLGVGGFFCRIARARDKRTAPPTSLSRVTCQERREC
jgi:hypothetical protein